MRYPACDKIEIIRAAPLANATLRPISLIGAFAYFGAAPN
jgi:hypothetical protein